jgi:putative peptidoglycan lipid II flippase
VLTVPASAGLAILGESMIAIVYQHGHFLASDTRQTAIALSCYAAGLASYALVRLLAPAFYALGDARTPMFVSVGSVAVNAAVSFATVRVLGLGHAGLALSLSAVSIFNAVTLLALLAPRIGGVGGRGSALTLGKVLLAAAVMALVCLLVVYEFAPPLVRVLVGIPAGAAVYYAVASVLGLLNSEQTICFPISNTRSGSRP